MLKKSFLISSIFAAALILNGCDSGIYSAEKRLWHANREYNNLLRASEKATPVDYQKVIDSFREITIRYPMWPNSAQAQFNIGQLYAMQGNLSKARNEFAAIVKDYPTNVDMCARSLFMIALTYEKEDNWPKAKETLDKISKDYSATGTAFQVLLHIAEYHKIKGRNADAETAYAAALEKYKKSVKDNPKTYGALITVDLIMTCYGDRQRWDEALDYLDSLIKDYPDTPLAAKAMLVEGAVYEQKLNRPEKARELYRGIIEKYPNTVFEQAAKRQIAAMDNK